jgi:hypothetical protein
VQESSRVKINSEQSDALDGAYQDNFAKHMIVAADPAQAPENFTGSVFSSEEEKVDLKAQRFHSDHQAIRSFVSNVVLGPISSHADFRCSEVKNQCKKKNRSSSRIVHVANSS